MSYREFLGRICQLFKADSDAQRGDIKRRLRSGRHNAPAQPMSDQELARAIQEFQKAETSDGTRPKPAERLADASGSSARLPTRRGGQAR
jgi:hypothetical protein